MQQASVSKEDRSRSPITAIIFDYGQVLVPSPTAEEFRPMAEMFNVDFDSFFKLWEDSRNTYDRGDISAEQYWLKLAAASSISLDRGQIETLRKVEVELWSHPDPAMLAWLSAIHSAGFKTALLSNMPLDLMRYVLANFHWMDDFTFKTFSADVRIIKPDPAIYEHTLRGLAVSASETLFVDDREANIRTARMLGMYAIQFRSIAQLKDELEALGFPLLPVVSGATASASRSPEGSAQGIKFQL
jgi:putative hydrolase of the HAD superfamily